MLYYLFDYLEATYELPGAGLFRYITFRAGVALILSLIITMLFGKRIIGFLKRLQIRETQRALGLDGEKAKEGTPTMGGVLIILGILIPCLLVAKCDNIYILLLIFTTIWAGGIGFIDDYIKVFKRDKSGLKGKFKILGQVILGAVIGSVMLFHSDIVVRMDLSTAVNEKYEIVKQIDQTDDLGNIRQQAYVKTSLTNVPFMKGNVLSYEKLLVGLSEDVQRSLVWILFIPLVIFIITSLSNAVNLTDGLDGLATGVSAIVGGTLAIFAYVSGHVVFSDYLDVFYIPYSEEVVVYAACFVGSCIGFLWYNSYPAKVFMGDTGSLCLGAIIATMAIILRKELLIPFLCGVFLIEILSVVIQVSWFKYTRRKSGVGKRIFKMAPLHHHFQKLGMHEVKVVTRFWIIATMLAVVTIITLKIR